MTTLFALPFELLVSICEQLCDAEQTLRTLALTCSRLQAAAEPVLYRLIFFRKPSELARLLNATQSSSRRLGDIREINARFILPARGRTNARPFAAIEQLVRSAPSIHTLTIESPYCNSRLWQAATHVNNFDTTLISWLTPIIEAGAVHGGATGSWIQSAPQPRPFQTLKKLTLHLNGIGREFWTLNDRAAFIFTHPTLEDLHLSSVNVPGGALTLVSHNTRTQLKALRLDEANITQDGFHRILSIPTALEYLYIGENEHSPREKAYPPGENYNRLCFRDSVAFSKALQQQCGSLQTLIYTFDVANQLKGLPSQRGFDLSAFTALRKVKCKVDNDGVTAVFFRASTAPPNLEHLISIDHILPENLFDEHSLADDPVVFRHITESNPHLSQLDIIGEMSDVIGDHVTPIGTYMRRKGITLRLFEPSGNGRFVPPFLYGEEEPADVLLYANDELGFRQTGINDTSGNPSRDEWQDEDEDQDQEDEWEDEDEGEDGSEDG